MRIGAMADSRPPESPSFRFDAPMPYGRVPVVDSDTTAGDAITAMVGQRFESAAHLAVCRAGALLGMARIEDVLAAEPATPLRDLNDADPPVVASSDDEDEEVAAWRAVRHGESALAVTDEHGQFAGIIPPRRIVEVLLTEHDGDMARLGGYLASTSSARHAIENESRPACGTASRGCSSVSRARSRPPASWARSSAS